MAKYVFPGADASMPLNWVIEQMERAGFEIESVETLGVHYSATICRWYENWMDNKDKVVEKYGVRWFRVWEVRLNLLTVVLLGVLHHHLSTGLRVRPPDRWPQEPQLFRPIAVHRASHSLIICLFDL